MDETKLLNELLMPVVQTVVLTILGFVAAQLNGFLKSKKILNQDLISKEQEAFLAGKTMEAIAYTQERSRQKAKETGRPLTSQEKLNLASITLMEWAREKGIELIQDLAAQKVMAKLPEARDSGVMDVDHIERPPDPTTGP